MIKLGLTFFGGRGGRIGVRGSYDRLGFKSTDSSSYHQLYNGRQYYNQQDFDIETRLALQDYVSDTKAPGSLYSPSQQLNYAMKNGDTLTANQQYMKDTMNASMHNLGYNCTLTRYARVDFMENLGIQNYESMTEGQLKQALIGMNYREDGFISTSYNNFKNAPNNGAPFTDKAVKINYKAPAGTQALMAPIGGGGDLGEIVMAPNQKAEITGVRFTGKKGRSGSQMHEQIEIDVTIKPKK